MIIGISKEIKSEENRVCMTPAGVEVMVKNGHNVLVEKNAGLGSGFTDDAYTRAGAKIVDAPKKIYASADMIMHVKEPLPPEYDLLRQGQIVFTYLHLAADEPQTRALIKSKAICIAYETIQKADGSLPLLTPMSEVAGRMAIQEGARFLEMPQGGHGILLGGVPGVEPATVVVIGGGVVGCQRGQDGLRPGGQGLPSGYESGPVALPERCDAGQLLHPDVQPGNDSQTDQKGRCGGRSCADSRSQGTPKLVTRDMLATMKNGSVLVDVSIDQGGCFETSKPTTHGDPTFVVDGVIHYCVANIPGAVAKTSTLALTNATLPYALQIANLGWKRAMQANKEIKLGANVIDGKVTYKAVAEAFGLDYTPVDELLN